MSNIEVNDASHWREFENNPLSHSMAHYLMAIDSLRSELGVRPLDGRGGDAEVSRGAASMALSQLKKRGWVAEDPNRFLLLTDEGRRITHAVEHNFLILSRFFEHTLGVSNDTALGDACKMEHLMSRDTAKRLLWLFKHLVEDKSLAKKVGAVMEGYSDKWDPASTLEELTAQLDGEPSKS